MPSCKAPVSRVDLTETLREMEERDKRDSERDLAPLRQADDALLIDSSSVDADAGDGAEFWRTFEDSQEKIK